MSLPLRAHHPVAHVGSPTFVRRRTIAVTVVLPTYNEAEGIRCVVAATQIALRAYSNHQIVVVDDDSPDETWRKVETLTRSDPRIHCHRRVDRRGLASAIVDGLRMATGEVLVVMDADLQHDPATIPRLVAAVEGGADIAVASRYADGGSTGRWRQLRRWASRLAGTACRRVLGLSVTDPMSGFFAIRRGTFHAVADRLRPRGFKALLEILSRSSNARVAEIPYAFSPRWSGRSKLDLKVLLDYVWQLVELRTGRDLSARFLQYWLVGFSGVLVQLGALAVLRTILEQSLALALAIFTATVPNVFLDHVWTFRDRRLEHRGWGGGLLRCGLVFAPGAAINYAVSLRLHQVTGVALLWTSLAGIALATIWNYQLDRGFTSGLWGQPE